MFFPQRPGAGFIPILTIMDHHVRRTHSPFISNYHEVEHVVRYQGRASCDGDKFAARGCHIGVNPDGLEQGGEVNACGLRREGVDLVNIAPTTAMSGFATRAGHRLFAFKDLQPTLPKCGRPLDVNADNIRDSVKLRATPARHHTRLPRAYHTQVL